MELLLLSLLFYVGLHVCLFPTDQWLESVTNRLYNENNFFRFFKQSSSPMKMTQLYLLLCMKSEHSPKR